MKEVRTSAACCVVMTQARRQVSDTDIPMSLHSMEKDSFFFLLERERGLGNLFGATQVRGRSSHNIIEDDCSWAEAILLSERLSGAIFGLLRGRCIHIYIFARCSAAKVTRSFYFTKLHDGHAERTYVAPVCVCSPLS